MSEPRWILIALLAVLLLASARLCWQQWRGPVRARGVFAGLLLLQIAVTALLYLTLVPPMQRAAGGQLTVLTAAAEQVRWSAAPGETVVALPEAPTAAEALRAPDLATALRQHPGTTSLRLIGDGLTSRDRDVALPRGVRLASPGAPQGWMSLQPPPVTAPGAVFTVSARAQGVPDARAELVDPAGLVVDRATPGADGSVHLDGVARVPGQSVFRLRLLDAGQHVVDTLAVPVDTVATATPRLLILAGAPGPELKYLRRWATDAGLRVQAQANTGGGVSLGDAPITLTAARWAETDVVVLDERSLVALSATQRSTLQQAIRNGLGVLVRTSGPVGDGARQVLRSWGLSVTGGNQPAPLSLPADADAALLQARRGPQRPASDATAYIEEADAASHQAALPVLERWAVQTTDATPLLHDDKGASVGGYRALGRGRVALLPVTDSYRLVLAGRDDRHAELWSSVLASIARALPAAEVPRIDAITPWAGERMALCQLQATAQVRAPDGALIPLRIDPASGTERCAGYWPAQAGWHQLQQSENRHAFYVFDPATAQPLHRQQLREATAQRLAGGTAAAPAGLVETPGARWPWLLAFVLAAGLLWWLERRRTATTR
ncbi:hypothetical protein ABE473_02865 [Stenotrophomonas sp. TWI700]|uniref:hypothetical protein n=1 Tax=Stenotrophomonas sp. TWI700 TaxID=3136792 RepID=UPI003207FCE4